MQSRPMLSPTVSSTAAAADSDAVISAVTFFVPTQSLLRSLTLFCSPVTDSAIAVAYVFANAVVDVATDAVADSVNDSRRQLPK